MDPPYVRLLEIIYFSFCYQYCIVLVLVPILYIPTGSPYPELYKCIMASPNLAELGQTISLTAPLKTLFLQDLMSLLTIFPDNDINENGT